MPPFWAPEMVTGPLADASWLLPVLPPWKSLGLVPGDAPEPPEPPQAARASRPTEESATSGVFSLMYESLSLTDGLDERTPRSAPGAVGARSVTLVPGSHRTSR